MPNPGSFTGSRGEFLKQQRALYAQGVKDGNINDVVADIQRRYFKRYPITLSHDEEPSEQWLGQINDDAPDPEIEPPNVDGMSPVNASKALQEHTDLMKKLKDRKDSIRRRLAYMYSKEMDPHSSGKSTIASDIISALTAKIVGVDSKIPRQKTPYNIWGPQHREIVDPVFNKRVEDDNIPLQQQIALRSSIYKELFNKLPEDERELWAKAAVREHEKAVREIRNSLEKGASTTPQDRQRVITSLPVILEPIFDLLADYTGWKFSVIAGGPEPADAGRLNMIMIHSGVIPGTVKADFGRDQHEVFKKQITPSFGSFLKKCYTIDECRLRALPDGFDIRSLADVKAEEPLDLHTFDIDKEHADASKSHKAKRLFEKDFKPRKSKQQEPLQGSTSSLPFRFGHPAGKTKKRELPSKDKPKNIFSQGFSIDNLGDLPEKYTLPADEASALYGAVAAALQCYVSTAARSDPSTPAPSRDPLVSQSHDTDSTFIPPPPPPPQAEHTTRNAQASPITALISLPPSPAASRSPSPFGATEHGAHQITPFLPPTAPSGTLGTPSYPPTSPPLSGICPSTSPLHAVVPASDIGPLTRPLPAVAVAVAVAAPASGILPSTPLVRTVVPASGIRSSTPPLHAIASASPPPSGIRSPSPPLRTVVPASDIRPSTPLHAVVHLRPPSMSLSREATLPLPQVTPSQSTTASRHSSIAPPSIHNTNAASTTSQRLRTPSGAIAVPELPSVDEHLNNNRGRGTRVTSGSSEKRSAPSPKRDAPKKKQRMAAGAVFNPAFPLELPSNCPGWVRHALDLLTREDLGTVWREVVVAWLAFEESAGFDQDGQRLCAQGRPSCIGEWVKRARSARFEPTLGDLGEYETTFVTWWNSLQPDWRSAGEDIEVGGGRDGDDWGSLSSCHGVNGLLSAIAALFFWGSAMADKGESAGWNVAAADALYVLQQLK